MRGKILGFSSNSVERFIADTRTRVTIIPRVVAERIRVKCSPVDADEPDYEGVTEMHLTVIFQVEFFVQFKVMRYKKMFMTIVCEEAGKEIIVDLDSLIQWTIIPKCFPLNRDQGTPGQYKDQYIILTDDR